MKPTVLAGPLLIVVVCLGLAGCGQKSALYLPGHNPNPPQPMIGSAEKPNNTGGDANDGRHDRDGATTEAQSSSNPDPR